MLEKLNQGKYLTVRWNNWLTLALGVPALLFAVVALATSLGGSTTGFVVFFILGAFY